MVWKKRLKRNQRRKRKLKGKKRHVTVRSFVCVEKRRDMGSVGKEAECEDVALHDVKITLSEKIKGEYVLFGEFIETYYLGFTEKDRLYQEVRNAWDRAACGGEDRDWREFERAWIPKKEVVEKC